jgi:hypothetical protein
MFGVAMRGLPAGCRGRWFKSSTMMNSKLGFVLCGAAVLELKIKSGKKHKHLNKYPMGKKL